MNCPYCLSDIDEDASVCKICKRDLYLLQPFIQKIIKLENQLNEFPDREAYNSRIYHLESLIDKYELSINGARTNFGIINDIFKHLIIPLFFLLFFHTLITVIYELNIIYLRIISIIMPFLFGYYLFKNHYRSVFYWSLGAILLSILSVFGMCGTTSIVDNSKFWPSNIFAWREIIEYSISIAFSFLSGMFFGGMIYSKNNIKSHIISHFINTIIVDFTGKQIPAKSLPNLSKNLYEFRNLAATIATISISIISGLKILF